MFQVTLPVLDTDAIPDPQTSHAVMPRFVVVRAGLSDEDRSRALRAVFGAYLGRLTAMPRTAPAQERIETVVPVVIVAGMVRAALGGRVLCREGFVEEALPLAQAILSGRIDVMYITRQETPARAALTPTDALRVCRMAWDARRTAGTGSRLMSLRSPSAGR